MEIFVFGDSITQGFFDDEQGGWCSRLAAWGMQKGKEVEVFNLGVSGDNTVDLLARFEIELLAREPEQGAVVVFAVGINDAQSAIDGGKNRVPLESFERNLGALYESARSHVSRVCFVGLTPVDEGKVCPTPWKTSHGYTLENVKQYDSAVRGFCMKRGASFIPMLDIFDGGSLNEFLADGLHPNAVGHKRMFERVRDAVEKQTI